MAHDFSVEQYNTQVKAVWRATFWLSVITVIEVAAALMWIWFLFPDGGGPRWLLNIGFILMSLLKAFFIVGEFMHIRYEKRALTLTVLVPTFFLIWFIIAFLWEGAEWNGMRKEWKVIDEQHVLHGTDAYKSHGDAHGDGHHDSNKGHDSHGKDKGHDDHKGHDHH